MQLLIGEAYGVDAVLFPEERLRLRNKVADFVRARFPDAHVIPAEALENFVAVARDGMNSNGSMKCAAPMAPFLMVDEKYPNATRVGINASCLDQGCELIVYLDPEKGGSASPRKRWEAPVAVPADIENWLAAVDQLAPNVAPAGGLFGMSEDSEGPQRKVRIKHIAPIGAWDEAPQEESFSFVRDELDACWASGWISGGTESYDLGIGNDGTVTRCEPTSRYGKPFDSRNACHCKALSKQAFASASHSRRMQVQLMNSLDTSPMANGKPVFADFSNPRSTGGSVLHQGIYEVRHGVASCFLDKGDLLPVSAAVRWTVGADGRLLDTEVTFVSPTPQAECVKAALDRANFHCPTTGSEAVVEYDLQIR